MQIGCIQGLLVCSMIQPSPAFSRPALPAQSTAPAPVQLRIITETCPRCQGSGRLPHYRHVEHGRCFRCQGAGHIQEGRLE
jgi:hypothetical protein